MTRFRNRNLIFHRKDEAILSLLLRERFPSVRFINTRLCPRRERLEQSSLALCHVHGYTIIEFDDPPEPDPRKPATKDARRNPGPFLRPYRIDFQHSTWFTNPNWFDPTRLAFDLPTMNIGGMSAGFEDGDEDARRVYDSVMRLLSRMATNRILVGHPLGNKLMAVSDETPKHGGNVWAGFQALAWCQRGARRMLDGVYRAPGDWQLPADDAYRALVEEVEALHGPDLGAPETETVYRVLVASSQYV